jgi:predicted ABC-type ATPase
MPRSGHPNCYIIAGSNGAGKTTFATEFLPNHVKCVNFINADLIARGLSPFDPDAAMVKAGRLVLERIDEYSRLRADFAFSGRSYAPILRRLRTDGYRIHMFYLWIPSVHLALSRIRDRTESGGHNVPAADVRRRFGRTVVNLFTLYRPLVDLLQVFDNSLETPRLIFIDEAGKTAVYDATLFNQVLREVNQ